ncbi:MAG: PD40 domain-containing protein [Alphaproteobacteria bacterium]|nr:PD40 domain-containing protein [Alphaproteobacteria bacterium]
MSVARAANELHVHERDITNAVNLVSGVKFPALVNKYRIERAKELLAEKDKRKLTITDIQFLSGFNTKSNFHRVFKNETGCSPTEYLAAANNRAKRLVRKKDPPNIQLKWWPMPGALLRRVALWGTGSVAMFWLLFPPMLHAAPLNQYDIVFDSNRSGFHEIHIMDGDGQNVRQITSRRSEMADHDARWIPGENRIAFQSYRGRGWRIWSIGLDGKTPSLVTDYTNYEGEPHWNAAGDRMLFTSYRPAQNIMLADGQGRTIRRLTSNHSYRVVADHPKWIPGQYAFTYVSDRDGDFDVYRFDIATGASQSLTDNAFPDFYPTVSPGGKWMAYLSERNGVFDTFLINLAEGTETPVSQNTAASASQYNSRLMERSSSLTALAPAWSPDGSWLAFFCFMGGNAEICALNLKSRSTIRLTNNIAHDGAPAWRLKPAP